MAIYIKLNTARGQAFAMLGLGNLAFAEKRFQDALGWTEKALSIFDQTSDKYSHARALHQLGKIQKQLNEFNSALVYLKKSLTLFEELGDERAIGAVAITLGGLYIEGFQDVENAKIVLMRAIKIYDDLGITLEANKARHNLQFTSQVKK